MRKASATTKALPFGCLVVAFAASLTLILIRNNRYTKTLPNLVHNYRAATQIIVQILSTCLAMAQVFSLDSLINFAGRIELFKKPTSLGNLTYWAALSPPQFTLGVPLARLVVVIAMLSLGTALGALWTGSLTPLATHTSQAYGTVQTPYYTQHAQIYMYPRFSDGAIITGCGPPVLLSPMLGNCVVLFYLGSLLSTVSNAVNISDPLRHPKIDNSTWTYIGRSYGQGSATGVFPIAGVEDRVAAEGFSYVETGYKVQASCNYPDSEVFPFTSYYQGTAFDLWESSAVTLKAANKSIPPFNVASGVWDGVNSRPFGYFAWTTFRFEGGFYLAASTQQDSWASVPSILCTIDFMPMSFLTNVSTVNHTITVTPLKTLPEFGNQSVNVANATVLDIDLLSRMTSSSSSGWSALRNAVMNGVNASEIAYNMTTSAAWLYSLENAIEGLADDLLTYQGMLAVARDDGESQTQPVEGYFQAIKIGQTYAALRTRLWRDLPEFDFRDLKAVLLAALGPGVSSSTHRTERSQRLWNKADEDDLVEVVARYDEYSKPRLYYASTRVEHEMSPVSTRPVSLGGSSLRGPDSDAVSQLHDSNADALSVRRPLLDQI